MINMRGNQLVHRIAICLAQKCYSASALCRMQYDAGGIAGMDTNAFNPDRVFQCRLACCPCRTVTRSLVLCGHLHIKRRHISPNAPVRQLQRTFKMRYQDRIPVNLSQKPQLCLSTIVCEYRPGSDSLGFFDFKAITLQIDFWRKTISASQFALLSPQTIRFWREKRKSRFLT